MQDMLCITGQLLLYMDQHRVAEAVVLQSKVSCQEVTAPLLSCFNWCMCRVSASLPACCSCTWMRTHWLEVSCCKPTHLVDVNAPDRCLPPQVGNVQSRGFTAVCATHGQGQASSSCHAVLQYIWQSCKPLQVNNVATCTRHGLYSWAGAAVH